MKNAYEYLPESGLLKLAIALRRLLYLGFVQPSGLAVHSAEEIVIFESRVASSSSIKGGNICYGAYHCDCLLAT